LTQLRAWRSRDIDLRLSVNLSARNLLDRSFPRTVTELLEIHEIPPDRLQFELTENTIMRDPTRSLAVLSDLRDLGVGLAVDAVGTGYSSLSHLNHLPVTELKIDPSCVMHLMEDDSDARLAQSSIDHSRNLPIT